MNEVNFNDAVQTANTLAEKENTKKLIKEDSLSDNVYFDYYEAKKFPNDRISLGKVIGHESQKEEIIRIINWFKDSKSLKEKGVSYPHGIVLFGPFGCGKSLIIKEIINCAEAPVFIFKNNNKNNISGAINETFKKAREVGHAIVVLDELDLLIDEDKRVLRSLQENLDGVESADDILVLAATNDLDEIPDALLRHGRLEKQIFIPYPAPQESLEMLKIHLKNFNVSFSDALDDEELTIALSRIPYASIKAIANDVVLRNGFENITNEMIYHSIFNVIQRSIGEGEEQVYDIAVHEASHAFVASKFPEFFQLNRLNIAGASGEFHAKEVKLNFWTFKKVLASACIDFAGTIGQKIICGSGSRGCENDLETARNSIYNAVNKCGMCGCWRTLPNVSTHTRVESMIKKRSNERAIERILKKCERKTYKIISKNKETIKKLADALFEKKHLKSSEIYKSINAKV